MSDLTPEQRADTWNARYPVGTPVRYQPILAEAVYEYSVTRTPAWVAPSCGPLVSIENRSGGLFLAHIEPLCVEAEVRAAVAAEIERNDIPDGLLDRDHDDQLTALRHWHAFIAAGTCLDCSGTGVDAYGSEEPCGYCAGYGTYAVRIAEGGDRA